MHPVAVVESFIAAWNRMDFQSVMDHLHQDIAYHNIPMTPLLGKTAVRDYLATRWIFSSIDWQVLHIAANGNVVLTERVDRFTIGAQAVSLPVMGTYEIHAGLIRAWRDYFDLAGYQAQFRTP